MLTTNGLWPWITPVKWLRIQSLLINGAQIAQAPCCNEFTGNFLISEVAEDPNGKECIRIDITAIFEIDITAVFETFQESRNLKTHRVRLKISQSLCREKPTGKGKLTGGFHHMIQSKCCLPDLKTEKPRLNLRPCSKALGVGERQCGRALSCLYKGPGARLSTYREIVELQGGCWVLDFSKL